MIGLISLSSMSTAASVRSVGGGYPHRPRFARRRGGADKRSKKSGGQGRDWTADTRIFRPSTGGGQVCGGITRPQLSSPGSLVLIGCCWSITDRRGHRTGTPLSRHRDFFRYAPFVVDRSLAPRSRTTRWARPRASARIGRRGVRCCGRLSRHSVGVWRSRPL